MKKLLIICGPTATGKSALAIRLAKRYRGEIVSADSRQVYQKLNIGTGKDLPKGAKYKFKNKIVGGCYRVYGINLWGYDLVEPKQEFNVARFVRFAKAVIAEIWQRNSLPILTGGTGFYIKAITDGIDTAGISINKKLRYSLIGKSKEELFEMLANLDAIKAASLNLSDKKNPRRLIRAIEVANWLAVRHTRAKKQDKFKAELLFIGLTAPKKVLDKKIDERVDERITMGIEKEIKRLIGQKQTWQHQAMSSLGYLVWKDYFMGKKSRVETINKWKVEEHQYAKRQLTWFKKDRRINWFDVSQDSWQKKVENLVNKWYITH